MWRRCPRRKRALLACGVALLLYWPDILRAQNPGPPPDQGVLTFSAPLRLAFSIDVTAASQVFEELEIFEAGRNNARLRDGRFAAWSYVNGDDGTGVLRPVALGPIALGATPHAVGIGPFTQGVDGPATVPANVPCEVIDVERLRIPSPEYEFIAACRLTSKMSPSELVLFDASGRYERFASSSLSILQISTASDVHASQGLLELVAGPEGEGRLVLQRYLWTR